MIKYYNSLSWRLGTQLKTREPDKGSQDKSNRFMSVCLFFIFTLFLTFSQANATTCPNATLISHNALPTGQSVVCGAANDVNAGNATVCGSTNYLGGLEALYTFTPLTTGTFNIAYSGQSWTGIIVWQGCPTSGGTCVGNVTSSGTSKNLNVSLTAGIEYYIMFDTWPTPNSPCAGTFTMTGPPPPSNNPPTCATTYSPLSGATGVVLNPTLSWSGSTEGPTSYDVYFGTSTSPAFAANVLVPNYTPVSPLLASTTYYWVVIPKNAIGDAVGCIEQTFTTGTSVLYCTPSYSSGCGGTGADAITNVVLGSLSNASGCAASPYYTFYDAVTVPDLPRGLSQNISITVAGDPNQFTAVWIDFNQNGFFESSEGFVSGNAGANGTAVISISVPFGAVLGNTRMRVRGGDDSALTTAMACGASASTWGEAEDYIVNITEAPSCLPPTAPLVSAVTSSGANLAWTASPSSPFGYEWAVTTSATPPVSGTYEAGTSVVVTTLDENTVYYLHVRSECIDDVEFSDWVTSTAFVTDCNAISSFPWFEGFETSSVECLRVINGNADGSTWTLSTTNPRTGVNCARMYTDISTSNNDYLITPRLALDANPKRLKFWVRSNSTGEPDEISVRVSNTGTALGDFTSVALASTPVGPTTYFEIVVDLTAYASQDVYLAFVRDAAPANGWYLHLDDITVENIPSCEPPATLTVSNILETTADLSWSASSTSNIGYEWAVTGSATPPVSGTFEAGTTAQATGLTAGDTYYLHVRTECIDDVDFSTWTTSAPFKYIFGDTCASAIDLATLTSPYSGTTAGAADNFNNTCAFGNTSPDLVFYIDVPNGATLNIGQPSNSYDSENTLFYGGACPGETQIACYDDPDTTSNVWVNTTGTTQRVYWVQDGYFDQTTFGAFELAWSVVAAPIILDSFTPDAVCSDDQVGFVVTLTGSNFTGANDVQLNGVSEDFVVINDTTIEVTLDASSASGLFRVYNPDTFVEGDDAFSVNQNPTVDPITAPDTAICLPGTLELTSSPGGTWSSSDEGVATVVGGTVTGVSAGTTTISYSITDNGCTTVVTYDVDVYSPVSISAFTETQTVVTGNDATFSVTATGSGLTYQWFAFDGIDTYELDDSFSLYGETYTGSTTASLLIGGVPADMNGFEFYCEVTGISPCTPETTTPNSILSVGDTGIGDDPDSVTLCDGGSTTFTVVRSGEDDEEDITYAWEYDADNTNNWLPVADGDLDGMTIADSDTATLSVSTITLVHNGYRFRAVVTGPANAATSNPATLTVNEGVSITDQPDSTSVCRTTTTANFSVATDGSVSGIQWQVSPNGVDTWSNVGTGASLNVNITPATPVGVTYYKAVVSGNSPCLPLDSDVVTLTVTQPTIVVTPSSASYCIPGDPVSLTASGAATYTWSPATGLSATTGATVTASPPSTTIYTVTGVDGNGCSNSTTVTVTVGPAVSATVSATPDTFCPDSSSQLLVTTPVVNVTAANYSFSASAGTYTPIVGGTNSTATGDDGSQNTINIGFPFAYSGANYTTFSINTNGFIKLGQTIQASPWVNGLATNTNIIGAMWDDDNRTTGSISYQVSGSTPNRVLTVQWANVAIGGGGSSSNPTNNFQIQLFEGTNAIRFNYGSLTAANGLSASIGLSSVSGNYLSVTPLSPVGSSTTSNSTANNSISSVANIPSGTSYTFTPPIVPTYTYAWSPSTYLSNTNTANPMANNVAETTTYTVVVTNNFGCSNSYTQTLTVQSGAAITTQPVSVSQCAGTNASFSVVATGPGLTYQWRKEGVDIDGATSASYTINNISATDSGTYDVVVTPLCGAPLPSDEVTLTVNALPTAVASNDGPACEGSNVGLTGTSDIGTTFSWTGPNGFSSTDQNPTISGATLASAGTYTFTATSAFGCATSGTTTVTIFENPQVSINPSSDPLNACVGEVKNLTAVVNPVNVVVLTEDFNGVTNNWTTANNSTGGTVAAPAWTLRPSGFVPPGYPALVTNDASQFYLSNSDAQGSGSNTNVILQSPAFSSVGMSSLSLNFNHFYRDFNGADFAYVEVSTNGSTWTTLQTYTTTQGTEINFANASVSLNAYINQPTVYVRYRYVAVWGYFWAINSVTVSGQTSPALTWSPTTDLYTDESATVPYTGAPASSVYARVTGPASYTVTSTTNGGCTSDDTVTFNITTSGCPSTTAVQPSQCGVTLAAINSYVYANIVSGAQGYRFRVTNTETNEVQTIDQLLRAFRITQLTNYAFDTEYSIEVSVRRNNVWEPYYGSACTVSTPDTTTQIQASQCNSTLTNIANSINADIVPFATGYRFRVTNTLNPVDVQTIDRPIRDFKMTQLVNIQFNTTYNVEVAVRNTDGTYLSYGPVCNITTPLFPTVGLQDAQCDDYQVISNTEVIYGESYPGAQEYRFLLENLGQPYSQFVDKPLRTMRLVDFTGLLPSTTYTVRVAIKLDGVWGPYGKSCSIITPAAGRTNEVTRVEEGLVNDFKAIAYPNPFATTFAIDVRTANTEKVSLSVYDMTGRLLEVKEVNAEDVTNYQFGDRYPSGVYNVIVSQGEETRTVRVVKQ